MKKSAWVVRSLFLFIFVFSLLPTGSARAAAELTITPLTWNVIGLDSNNVNVGPNNFPVGARVCNTGDETANNVASTFNWEAVDPTPAKDYIHTRPGSNTSYSGYTLAPSACVDFYYEIQITRDSNAYLDTRRFYITATADGLGTVSTPRPRELYVERLISQNRNAVLDVKLNGASVPAGGTMNLIVGNTYEIELVGKTATNGYEQLESFINFPNTIFQVNSVVSTFSANAGTDSAATTKPYADGCGWVNDPDSPNYRSCTGTGKYGGSITVKYNVTIIGGGGTTQTLNTLIYDFSGSSYHYNADFTTGIRFAAILGPSVVTISKTFTPKAISPGGTSVMTFKLTNPMTETINGVNFTDTLLGGLKVAAVPNVGYSGCGAGAFSPAPAANDTSLSFSNGTLAPNSTCTITISVTADTAADYPNTTGNLFINNSVDTGNTGSDTLKVATTSACVPGQTLATWAFPSGSSATTPAPTTQAGNVATASASTTTTASAINTNIGAPAPSWEGRNFPGSGAVTGDTSPYFQFAIDTSKYSSVQISLSYARDSNWGGGSATTPTIYVWSSTTGTAGSFSQIFTSTTFDTTFRATGNLNAAATGSSLTYFRINAVGATNSQAFMQVDTVTVTGCLVPAPAPTITKSFSPDPIVKGAASTLTFTINNTAVGNVAQSGIAFTDVLPEGLSVADGTTSACNGTNNLVTTAATRTISLTGGSLAAGPSCTFNVAVTGVEEGEYENITGFLSSNESGTSTSYASDTLTVIAPPVLAKSFTPTSILTGETSELLFTITNPNSFASLSGIGFTDTLPAGVTAVNGTTGVCNGSLAISGGSLLTFSGGSLAAGGACEFSVTVTGVTVGTKNNTTSVVTSTEGGNGNAASATLVVSDPQPLIGLNKQISTNGLTWIKFVGLVPPQDVYYRFTISNDGETTLNGISVADPDFNMANCLPALPTSLAAGETASCEIGPLSISSAPSPDPYVNTATVTTTTYTPSPPVTSSAQYGTKSLALEKSADKTSYASEGETIAYSYMVTNDGGFPLLGPVTVTDDLLTVACPAVNTVGDNDNYLDPGESITCTASHTVSADDLSNGSITNNAHATVEGVDSPTDTLTLRTAPNLGLAKSNGVSTVTAGGTTTYTLTVSNTGNTATSGTITIVDVLPVGMNIADGAVTPGGTNAGDWTCNAAGDVITCTSSAVIAAVTGTSAFSFTVNVEANASGTLINPAQVGGGGDPLTGTPDGTSAGSCTGTDNPTKGCAVDSDTVVAPNLTLAKSDGGSVVTPGGTTTYTLTVSNTGSAPTSGTITVVDVLPAGMSIADGAVTPGGTNAGDWTCNAAGDAITCTSSAVIAATTGTSVFNFTVNVDAGASGALINRAQVGGGGDPTNPDAPTSTTAGQCTGTNTPNEGCAVDADTANAPSLGLSKSNGASTVTAGGTTTYTLTVSNTGDTATSGTITVVDVLPAGMSIADGAVTLGGADAGDWTCNAAGDVITCTSSAVIAATTGTSVFNFTVNVDADASGTLVNPAQVGGGGDPLTGTPDAASAASCTGTDNPTKGCAVDSDIVLAPDLELAKSDGVTTVTAGGTTTYTLTVSNTGNADASGTITVVDVLPAGMSIADGTVTPGGANAADWTCSAAANVITCTGSAVIAATTGTSAFNFTVNVDAGASGVLTNRAQVGGGGDPTNPDAPTSATAAQCTGADAPNEGCAVDSDTVNAPDLGLAKSNGVTSVPLGGTTTYVLTVSNDGNVSTSGTITVVDVLPVGMSIADGAVTLGGADAADWTCSAASNVVTCTSSAVIPASGASEFSFTVNILPNANGTLVNRAQVGGGGDPTNPNAPTGATAAQCTDANTPNEGCAVDSDTVSGVFDPPSAIKTFNDAGFPQLEFRMVWINSGNNFAIDVQVTDEIPTGTTYVPDSVTCTPRGSSTNAVAASSPLSPTAVPDSFCGYDSGNNRIQWQGTIGPDDGNLTEDTADNEVVITFRVTVNDDVNQAQNQGFARVDVDEDEDFEEETVLGTSFVGSNPVVWNRSASGVGDLIPEIDLPARLPATGFAPGIVTALTDQPASKVYAATDVWLEIPGLGVSIPIIGVPLVDGDWDVSWLGKQAGWLNGTAFPSWRGNSALTGHVTLSDGNPGPFANLGNLQWGNRIIIHAYGYAYVYEVRENRVTAPNDTSVLKHEKEAWLTLVTCKNYNESNGTYANRISVRAVLIAVYEDGPSRSTMISKGAR
jgi:LPXTG-site transpeptidase (sortase) family protein